MMAVGVLGTDFDALLVRGAVGALGIAALWLLVVVVAIALEARTGGRVQIAERTGCPRAARLWLLGLFVALFAGVAPAQANGHGARPHGPVTTAATALEGLPLPDRASGASGRVLVVRPGDTLWRIAHDLLRDATPGRARDPSPAAVARTVARLHAVNRGVIGDDPDLIRPGQHLTIPEEP
jgi:nucleoid-associated protein YgaU